MPKNPRDYANISNFYIFVRTFVSSFVAVGIFLIDKNQIGDFEHYFVYTKRRNMVEISYIECKDIIIYIPTASIYYNGQIGSL